MKRVFFLFLFFLLSATQVAFAHGPGSVSFLKINSEETKPYVLEDAGVFSSAILVPQDSAQENYIVEEEIAFTIDVHKLEDQFPLEDIKGMKFAWDFGDGKKVEGIEQKHSYSKPGSYIVNITSNKEEINESVLIHILPKKEYQLPKATIKVNDKKGTRENYNILEFDLNNSLTFDASESVAGSAKIISYTWDFGDDKNANAEKVEHQYQLPQAFATVVLRVEDENGLVADAFVNVRNSGSNVPKSPPVQGIAMIAGPVLIAFIAAIVGIYLKSRRKKK